MVHFFKQLGYVNRNNTGNSDDVFDNSFENDNNLEPKFVFNHWTYFVGWAAFGSYLIYFAVGGFLHVRAL